MTREDALERLRSHSDQLKALGVGALYLYGSVARGEADATSDVDLLVDPANRSFDAWALVGVTDAITEMLGVEADVHDYGGYLRLPKFRSRVEPDIIQVF